LKKFNPLTEFFYFMLITVITVLIIKSNLPVVGFIPISISLFIYTLLTLVFLFTFTKSTAKNKVEINLPKVDISESLKLSYAKTTLIYIGLFKISIAALPILLFILNSQLVISKPTVFIFMILNILLAFCFFIFAIKYFLQHNGYLNLSIKNTLKYGLFYYNKNDKRAVADKPFGIGTTINFASKQGRLIFYVIISIPITILILLITIISFVKKT